MKLHDEISALGPTERRKFLKWLGLLVSAPAVPAAIRFACNELAGGKAHAQAQETALGTYFIEFDFRDQVDLMHVFVPPALAARAELRRGDVGNQCTLYEQQAAITAHAGRVFLTPDSAELAPHVDTIAMIDTGEAGIGGVHGHEAANGMRSPGRTGSSSGRMPLFNNDGNSGSGNDALYGTVPTPASLHNYHQKQIAAGLRNGFAFKGISRAQHSVYHFAAQLPGAELDRIATRDRLFETFPAVVEDLNIVASPEQAELFTRVLRRADARFFSRRRFAEEIGMGHANQLQEAGGLLYPAEPRVVELPLTAEETEYWSAGVPNQQCTIGDKDAIDCGTSEQNATSGGFVKAQVWEQFAYASKLVRGNVVRSIALEFDFMDLHGDGVRTEQVLRTQARQCALPLARLIQSLKDAGIYDRTLIAVYTLDGSRRPAANSYGNDGKGTLMLAGGMIRGGYYGDIEVAGDDGNGHTYGFRAPDPVTGMPGELVTDWGARDKRTSSAAAWQTVAEALSIPRDLRDQFEEVAGVEPLRFMLR
jgi:Protein of unknown function (DUF1501)